MRGKDEIPMNKEKTEYFGKYFKMPWVNTLKKDTETEFPIVEPCHVVPEGLVRFDKIKEETDRTRFVAMFQHDSRLPWHGDEAPWPNIEEQAKKLRGFAGVIAPDYSVYSDMDEPAQRWNVYKNRVMSLFLRELGHLVIPCIQWADEPTFKFCFRGLPKRSVVAVSSVGCMRGAMSRAAFRIGYERMCRELDPEAVVFHGRLPVPDLGGPPRFLYDARSGDRIEFDQADLFGEVC